MEKMLAKLIPLFFFLLNNLFEERERDGDSYNSDDSSSQERCIA